LSAPRSPEAHASGPPIALLRPATLSDRDLRIVTRARTVLDVVLDELRQDLAPLAGRASIETKPDGTPVTPHDRTTDLLLTSRLLEAFPSHGVISEEAGHVAPGTDWTWVIDPIDGTSNFIAGVPYWCISVALCLDGAPALGVVEAPAFAQRYTAIAGAGAEERTDGRTRRLQVSDPVALHEASSSHIPGLYSGGAARDLTSDGVTLNARIMGAAALDLAMVARGSAPLAVTLGPHVWDVAAGGLLVLEAGGVCAGASDRPLLPLVPGRDYGHEVVRTAGATDEGTARQALQAARRGRTRRHGSGSGVG
jgi:myo-inositol-1(or 4)-monophosphatase